MLGLFILFHSVTAVAVWLALLGERLSFMQIGDEWRACQSPWLEAVFRATNSHNHTNPNKTPLCLASLQPRAQITTKNQFGEAGACCIHPSQSGYERQVLCSHWYLSVRGRAGEEMSLSREVSKVGGLVLNRSMHVSKGDNITHHSLAYKNNLRESDTHMHIKRVAGCWMGSLSNPSLLNQSCSQG